MEDGGFSSVPGFPTVRAPAATDLMQVDYQKATKLQEIFIISSIIIIIIIIFLCFLLCFSLLSCNVLIEISYIM